MKHATLFLLTTLLLFSGVVYGQKVQFKKYTNQVYKFSFDIPSYWTIKDNKEGEGALCIPVTKAEKDIYNDCYEDIVFRMDYYKLGLEKALQQDGSYKKVDSIYYTSDRFSDSVSVENIKGKTWTGIYHNNTCGINCKETGFHAAAGQCQFIYFSNGRTTIGINTNGRSFDDDILERILSSFRFD